MVDCDGEGQEQVVRDSGDSRVVMMAAAGEDGGSGRWRRRQTMTAADNNGMQDQAADYDGEGQERAARDGKDSRVTMMAAVAEDDSGGRRRW